MAVSQHRSPLWGERADSSTVLLRHFCKWEHATASALTPWSKYPLITRSPERGQLSWVILQLKKIKATIFFFFFLLLSRVHFYHDQEQAILGQSLHCCGLLLSTRPQIFFQRILNMVIPSAYFRYLIFTNYSQQIKNDVFFFKLEWFFYYFTTFCEHIGPAKCYKLSDKSWNQMEKLHF